MVVWYRMNFNNYRLGRNKIIYLSCLFQTCFTVNVYYTKIESFFLERGNA